MKLLDCHAYAGVGLFPPLEPALVPDTLLAEMGNCGVDLALVNPLTMPKHRRIKGSTQRTILTPAGIPRDAFPSVY